MIALKSDSNFTLHKYQKFAWKYGPFKGQNVAAFKPSFQKMNSFDCIRK